MNKIRDKMELEKDLLFSEYLEKNFQQGIIDFSIRVYIEDDELKFYIHPSHVEGETRDYPINQEFECGYELGILANKIAAKTVLILAGNIKQAKRYIEKNKLTEKNCKYIVSPDDIFGYQNCVLAKVGTWHERYVGLERIVDYCDAHNIKIL